VRYLLGIRLILVRRPIRTDPEAAGYRNFPACPGYDRVVDSGKKIEARLGALLRILLGTISIDSGLAANVNEK
jgi:hypothetical protein